jgi:biopolymer transport protein ExbB
MKVKMRMALMTMAFLLTVFALSPIGSFAEEKTDDPATPSPKILAESPSAESVEAKPVAADAQNVEMSLLDFIKKGGIVGYLIILLSVVSVGFIIDYSLRIRKSRILPQQDIDKLKTMIQNGRLEEIALLEKDRPSFLTRVTIAGLKESHLGQAVMIKAMEDASEALASGISRKIEHLNVIGNISPMLGLLGTVTGMLRCFNEIAHVAGAIEPKQLAGGIFEALVTTCLGLIVAIPSLYAYAVFKNRVDEYTGEAALTAEQLVTSFKFD